MEHEFESAPRDNTRRTLVFRSIKISGLSEKATLRWLRNVLPLAHTRAHGSLRRTPSVWPDVATGPAARCPPVCQGTAFPLRRNVEIIHYRADGRKWEI